MRVEKEFTVAAPLERAWEQLADLDALAACLPDIQLPGSAREPLAGREVILGLNGSGVRCRATLRGVDADEDEHAATLRFAGREIAGPGIGRGTVHSRLSGEDGRTRVRLAADVELTGRAPAADAVERTAQRLLDGFAQRLEEGMRHRAERPAPTPGAAAARAPERPAPEPAAARPEPAAAPSEPAGGVAGVLSGRAARVGAGAGLLLLVLGVLRALLGGGRGNSVSVSVRYRW